MSTERKVTKFSTFYKIEGFSWRSRKLMSALSTTDYQTGDELPFAYFYNKKRDVLRVPAGVGDDKISKMLNYKKIDKGGVFPSNPTRGTFKMKNEPLDYQEKAIDDIKKELLHKSRRSVVCDLPTGRGKTFLALHVIAEILKTRTIIFVKSMDTLGKQWKKAMFEHAKGFKYRVIEGSSMMMDLMTGGEENDIYIVTHSTVRSFIKKYEYAGLVKFFMTLGIGCKIYDEGDLETKSMFRVDSYTSIKYTIYLTATHYKSNKKDNKAFQLAFNDILKTGSKYFKEYKPNRDAEFTVGKIKFERGEYGVMYGFGGDFNKFKYAEVICQHPKAKPVLKSWIDREMKPMLKNKSNKAVLFVSSIKACMILRRTLIELGLDTKSIGVYNSEVEDKYRQYAKSRPIIISTAQSLSRGVDIKGLKYVYNVADPHGSLSIFAQMTGRVGRVGGVKGYYREMVVVSVKEVFLMYLKRKNIFDKEFTNVTYKKLENM